MTQAEFNAVKKAAEKMKKQESAQDEIIEMARQAGLDWHTGWVLNVELPNRFETFANLVAAKATAVEREACAKVCETHGVHPALNVWNGGPDWYKHGKNCAAVIRARGED